MKKLKKLTSTKIETSGHKRARRKETQALRITIIVVAIVIAALIVATISLNGSSQL